MYLSYFEQKPFYHELDFKSQFIEIYLNSLIKNRINNDYNINDDSDKYDLNSIYNLQNIIVYGNDSSGKTTQIHGFLASLFNTQSIYNLKSNVEGFRYKYSPFHIQFSVKNFKNSDIIDDNPNIKFIRNIVSTPNMGFNIPKILYITDFDKTSIEIQKFFLRIIEKSANNVRFILEINILKHLDGSIISRFLTLKCNIPSYEQVIKSLNNFYDKYIIQNSSNMIKNNDIHLNDLINEKEMVLKDIILNSNLYNFTYKPNKIHYNLKNIYGNISIYISSFQNQNMYKNIYIPMYIKKCIKLKNIIFNTTQHNFFENMNYIRDLLLELYVNNINSTTILNYLYYCIIEFYNYDFEITNFFIEKLSHVEHKMKMSNKDVIFIEMYIVYILKYILFNKKVEIVKEKIIVEEDKKIIVQEQIVKKDVEKDVEKEIEVIKEEIIKKRGRKKKV